LDVPAVENNAMGLKTFSYLLRLGWGGVGLALVGCLAPSLAGLARQIPISVQPEISQASPQNSGANWPLPALPLRPEVSPPLQIARILSGRAAVAFSPDGKTVASARADNSITLWNVQTGAKIRQFQGHDLPILAIAISPNGRFLASASHDKTVRVWDLATGAELATLRSHTDWVETLAISPDSRFMVSGGGDRTIRVWQVRANGQSITLQKMLNGHRDPVYALAISPNGTTVASTSWDEIRLWDVQRGEVIQTLPDQVFGVHCVAISPNGRWLVTAGGDRQIHIWNLASARLERVLKGHRFGISTIAITPDSRELASGSLDNTIKVWDLETGDLVRTLPRQTSVVQSIAIGPDGKLLVSGSWGAIVKLWNLQTGQELETLVEPAPTDRRNPV